MHMIFVYPNFNDPYYPNLGLTNLATYINEKTKHTTKIVDLTLFKKNWKELLNISLDNADLVGLTSTTGTIVSSLEVAREIKRIKPNLPIVIGGIYATSLNKDLLDFQEIDYVCVGEGEISLSQLLNALDKKEYPLNVPGIWYKENGKIIEGGTSPIIKNLDELPFNNYDLWDTKTIFNFINHFPMMGSRGCQYNCTFCTQSVMHDLYDKMTNFGYHRVRSPENICDEIEFQFKKYAHIKKFKGILFYDDTFTSSREFVFDFCEEFKKRGLNKKIHWAINARIENIDKDLLLELREAGCYYLYFGIESGLEETRSIYKKHFNEEKILEIINYCKKLGFRIKTYFIIDGPRERVKDNLRTLKFARKLHPDTLHIMPFVPLPRTKAAKIYKKTNPKHFQYISLLTDIKNDKEIVEHFNVLLSIVLGHMPGSYKDLLKYFITGLFSNDFSRKIYAKIILNTFWEYFISSVKYGKLRFFIDLLRFIKLSFKFNFVTSDIFAFTLKKYLLEISFK